MDKSLAPLFLIAAALIVTGCQKAPPMVQAGDQLADGLLKGRYADQGVQIESRAQSELGISAKKLVSQCAVAAMNYVKVPEAQALAVAGEILNAAGSDDQLKQFAGGVAYHLDRCINLPSAYDIIKK